MFSLMYLWHHFPDMLSALGLGEEEDIESPRDSEVLSSLLFWNGSTKWCKNIKARDAKTFTLHFPIKTWFLL